MKDESAVFLILPLSSFCLHTPPARLRAWRTRLPIPPPCPGRPPRQPRRTLIAGLVLLVFMLMVWFPAPGLRLPVFFSGWSGWPCACWRCSSCSLYANTATLEPPRHCCCSGGSARAGSAATFPAVRAWWLSSSSAAAGRPGRSRPVAAAPANLNMPLLSLDDAELATIVPPAPSLAARDSAAAVTATGIRFIVHSSWQSPAGNSTTRPSCSTSAAPSALVDRETLDLARAQLDLLRRAVLVGQPPVWRTAARPAAVLRLSGPRHAWPSARLAAEHADADQRAEQLLECRPAGARVAAACCKRSTCWRRRRPAGGPIRRRSAVEVEETQLSECERLVAEIGRAIMLPAGGRREQRGGRRRAAAASRRSESG